MSTYTQTLYQIVFSTKKRERTLKKENQTELYQYIWGILKNKKCHLYRINGVEDHLHIVLHLHPTIALSSLIKDIKIASSGHIKEKGLFPDFQGWQEGYGAFTYAIGAKDALIEYVKNQEVHHQRVSYQDELRALLAEHSVEFDEKYFE